MTVGVEVGIASVIVILVLIYAGVHVAVALGLVSFIGVWVYRDSMEVAISLLAAATHDTIAHAVFANVPLFALMGIVSSEIGLGADVYRVADQIFRRIRGGLGMATVAANALFASITGSSIASASVFTRIAVPEMLTFGYTRQFSVGVVAGSSVLGMLIPPSAMLIIYAIVAEQSVGEMFIAGFIPGILLAVAYVLGILLMSYVYPKFIGDAVNRTAAVVEGRMGLWDMVKLMMPVGALVVLVLGGIYSGWFSPEEAGAAGSAGALLVGIVKRRLTWQGLWRVLVETGHITAAILFLIISASMYSRMLGVAGLPTLFSEWLIDMDLGMAWLMVIYVILMVLLGTIIETASIILIVVPLFLSAVEVLGGDLVWFGIVTVIGAEIGLLTPPLGISCFTIKSTLRDPSITLSHIFSGAFPFAVIMLLVLILIIVFPPLSLSLL
ncbi:MAG: TRAP transporter large permease subunit [Alphaproteobacteria bacterium]|nr:TRAP transporter large permease subunit [Alphaproteobacteria bacterium]